MDPPRNEIIYFKNAYIWHVIFLEVTFDMMPIL